MLFGDRRGQITIFIIVGLLLAFIFFLVINATSEIQKDVLSDAQETIFGKLFRKESLRLYRDDCLEDSLSDALLLLGRQGGKLWAGDPGGTQGFQNGKNGITYASAEGEFRVFYGITRENTAANLYPCDQEPCTYTFPDTSVGFGNRPLLTKQMMEGEISSYLKVKVPECMQGIINDQINPSIQIRENPKSFELQTLITDEGIKVEGEYPLTMTLSGEEYFEISKVDVVYPSQLNKLLRTAVTNPLKYDQKYVDFSFRQETFEGEEFPFASKKQDDALRSCTDIDDKSFFSCLRALFQDEFQNLEILVESNEVEGGDDIFIVRTPITNIVSNPEDPGAAGEMFEFYMARQNRPPALDYINRNPCPGVYDYLIIPESKDHASDGTELGTVEIILNAVDPDEDVSGQEGVEYLDGDQLIAASEDGKYKIIFDATPPQLLTVSAKDKHGLIDSQDVAIFVDEGLTSSVTVENFYNGEKIISQEDPFRIIVTPPADVPQSRNIETTARVSFIKSDGRVPLRESITIISNGEPKAFGIPTPNDEGDGGIISSYDDQIGSDIATFLQTLQVGAAKISVSYQATYCPDKPESHSRTATSTVDVEVVECIPYENPERPYPFPYHQYKKDGETISLDDDTIISPYLASHTCCKPDQSNSFKGTFFTLEDNKECFRNPSEGCYGEFLDVDSGDASMVSIKPFQQPDTNEGFLALREFAHCTGLSGNTCGTKLYEFKLDQNNKVQCGNKNQYGCANIPLQCQDGPAFNFILNKGACIGKQGCESFCKFPSALVYLGAGPLTPDDLNNQLRMGTDKSEFLKCGCNNAPDQSKCDRNFDGRFEGTCLNDFCTEGIADGQQN